MKTPIKLFFIFAAAALLSVYACSFGMSPAANIMEMRTFTDSAGTSLPYRIYIPPEAGEGEKLPLLLYLHGAGHRGDDNTTQVYFEPGILARAAVGIQKLHTRRTTMSRRNAVGGHSMGGRLIQFGQCPHVAQSRRNL